jgi:hypothetical protein
VWFNLPLERGIQVKNTSQSHHADLQRWSSTGSKALGILQVVELNQQWDQLWFLPIGCS